MGDEMDNTTNELKDEIRKIRFKHDSVGAKIGTSEGTLLFESMVANEEFAKFQGVIGELVFALNGELLKKKAPIFSNFLSRADLLDFPGVARYEKNRLVLSKEDLAGEARPKIFTEILKRGKTAAIVATAGKIPTIDSFCILSQIYNFPSNPDQLTSGVRAWMDGLGYHWPPVDSQQLPLNLVLTFCGQFVNDVIINGIRIGVDRGFGKMTILGEIAQPGVAKHFLTTYPEFSDRGGEIKGDASQKAHAGEQIANSADFKRRFNGNTNTLDEMIRNGGTDYLFATLQKQVETSGRLNQIARQLEDCARVLRELLAEANPPDDSNSELRRKEIESWRKGIKAALERNRLAKPNGEVPADMSFSLRRLLQVEAVHLDPIPLNCKPLQLDEYLETQFTHWRQSSLNRGLSLEEVGLDDPAKANRVLGYLCDYAIRHCEIIPWIKANFAWLNEISEARQAQQFLALKMADKLALGNEPRPAHRDFSREAFTTKPDPKSNEVQTRLDGQSVLEQQVASIDNDLNSPHYLAFIGPFLKHLENVQQAHSSGRGPQIGDPELVALSLKLKSQLLAS
jgi:hypothetical protein